MLQWMARRQEHLLRAQQGFPISEYGVRFTYVIHYISCMSLVNSIYFTAFSCYTLDQTGAFLTE